MQPGRRPLPTPLKILRGTLEKSRENKHEARPKVKVPNPPCHLSPEEKKVYRNVARLLAPNGLATAIDGMALALLARAWVGYTSAGDKMKEIGPIAKTKNGNIIQNPYFAVHNKTHEQVFKMLVEFGMTPSSRSRVRSNNESPEDALDRLMR
jgi:P27 family predicted phage terminase small subunit